MSAVCPELLPDGRVQTAGSECSGSACGRVVLVRRSGGATCFFAYVTRDTSTTTVSPRLEVLYSGAAHAESSCACLRLTRTFQGAIVSSGWSAQTIRRCHSHLLRVVYHLACELADTTTEWGRVIDVLDGGVRVGRRRDGLLYPRFLDGLSRLGR